MRAVLDGDAGGTQRVANRVRLGEVAGLARFGAGVQLLRDQGVQHIMLAALAVAVRACGTGPRLGQRIQSQRIQHRPHRDQGAAHLGAGRIAVGTVIQLAQQRVAVANRGEDRRRGAGDVHVVIHRGDEIGGKIIGADPGDLGALGLLGCVVTLQLGAFSVVLETTLSGITALPLGAFAALMQPIHLAIGLVEGLITAAVLLFVYQTRPELLQGAAGTGAKNRCSRKAALAILAAAALVIGGGLSLLASSSPDGLEWSLFPVAGYQLAGLPMRLCFQKLRMVLPLVCAVGLLNPLFDRQIMVQVGTLNSLMTASFSDIVPAFRQRFPHVMMRLHADMVASLKDKLLKNELDLIYTLDSQVLDPQFVKVFEAEEEVVVVTNRDNPLAARESVRLAELVDHPFILMNRTNAYRDLFDTELARQGLEIRPFLELEDDVLALRLLYENPAYMTVLPLYTVKKSIHEKSLAAVRVEDCKMSQFRQVIYHKNKVLTPQIQGMLDTIVEVAKRPF